MFNCSGRNVLFWQPNSDVQEPCIRRVYCFSRPVSPRAGKFPKLHQRPELAVIRGKKEAASAVDTVVSRVNGNPFMIIRLYRAGAIVDPECIQPAFAADPG